MLVVGNDFGQLILNVGRVDRLVASTGEGNSGLVKITPSNEETRRFGQEEQATSQNERPKHLEADGDAVGAAVFSVLGSIVDAGRQEEADADAELVSRNDSAADLAGSNLGHVQNDDGGDETDTEASDQSSSHNKTEACRGGLEDDTHDKDSAAENDRGATTDPISKITSNESSEEGTGRENRGDERLVGRGEGSGVRSFDGVDEVFHAHDARDVTRVVSKEDTTESGEDAHQVGLDCDGGLDPRQIVTTRRGRGSTRHIC